MIGCSMNRRAFLQTAAAASLLGAADTPIRLGFDTYSLRAFGWKDMQLIDYAVAQGLDTIQFSSLGDFASLEPAHLKQVREYAAKANITIDGGTGCICSASKSWSAKAGYSREGHPAGFGSRSQRGRHLNALLYGQQR